MSYESYFRNSKIWYQSLYNTSYYTRFFYLILFILTLSCFVLTIKLYSSLSNTNKNEKLYLIAFFDHKEEGVINLYPKKYKNKELNILDFLIRNFIIEIESLDYEEGQNMNSIVLNKLNKIEKIFNEDLYLYYSDSKNPELSSDIDYIKRGLRKKINIMNLTFLDKNENPVIKSKMYQIFNISNTEYIKIEFSVYNELIQKQDIYEVYLKFDIKIPEKKNDNLYLKIIQYNKYKLDK